MNERLLDICIKAGINTWPFNEVGFISLDESELVKFAELIVQDAVLSEREECAKVADRQNGDDEEDSESCVWSKAARHIAAAIRARGSS